MTAARFHERHHAECSACGYETNHSSSGTFLSPFFLPTLCVGCGAVFSKYGRPSADEPHWLHVEEVIRRDPPVRTRNPLTWLRGSTYATVSTKKWIAT